MQATRTLQQRALSTLAKSALALPLPRQAAQAMGFELIGPVHVLADAAVANRRSTSVIVQKAAASTSAPLKKQQSRWVWPLGWIARRC